VNEKTRVLAEAGYSVTGWFIWG